MEDKAKLAECFSADVDCTCHRFIEFIRVRKTRHAEYVVIEWVFLMQALNANRPPRGRGPTGDYRVLFVRKAGRGYMNASGIEQSYIDFKASNELLANRCQGPLTMLVAH